MQQLVGQIWAAAGSHIGWTYCHRHERSNNSLECPIDSHPVLLSASTVRSRPKVGIDIPLRLPADPVPNGTVNGAGGGLPVGGLRDEQVVGPPLQAIPIA